MPQILEKRIETRGPDKFGLLVPQFESLHLISEIQTYRLTNTESRGQWFYGGDGAVYGLNGKDVILYLTDFANNPLIKDPTKASKELEENNNFFLDESIASDIEKKASALDGVVAFNLSKLPTLTDRANDEWGYIQVSTPKLAEGRNAFKAQYGDEVTNLFDRVHGEAIYGSNGIGGLLNQKDKTTTSIYMLNTDYVQQILKGKEAGTMVARASCLRWFDGNSLVDLDLRYVGNQRHARGVVREIAEGDAQKIMPYQDALKEANKIAPQDTPLNPIIVGLVDKIYYRQ